MSIVVIVLGIVFLAFGAIPPVASAYGTGALRQRLASSSATVVVGAVPTWRLLAGQADSIAVQTGPTTLNGWQVEDLVVRGGPCRVGQPCVLAAELAMRNQVLVPAIRSGIESYAGTLAETLGVAGASVADVQIALGPTTVVSGRFEAFGGLVALPFRLAGRPDRLGPNEIGLRQASVSLNGQDQPIGDIPLTTLPATVAEGVGLTLTRLVMTGTEVRVWATLSVSDPGRLMAPAPAGRGGSLPVTP